MVLVVCVDCQHCLKRVALRAMSSFTGQCKNGYTLKMHFQRPENIRPMRLKSAAEAQDPGIMFPWKRRSDDYMGPNNDLRAYYKVFSFVRLSPSSSTPNSLLFTKTPFSAYHVWVRSVDTQDSLGPLLCAQNRRTPREPPLWTFLERTGKSLYDQTQIGVIDAEEGLFSWR
jgi:hypothetical protein